MATKKKSGAMGPANAQDWQARDDMYILSRAEEIRADPARYKRAIACGKKELKRLQKAIER